MATYLILSRRPLDPEEEINLLVEIKVLDLQILHLRIERRSGLLLSGRSPGLNHNFYSMSRAMGQFRRLFPHNAYIQPQPGVYNIISMYKRLVYLA